MTDIKTHVYKSFRDGWAAESTMPLPILHDGKKGQLRIGTSKRSNGNLDTYANVQFKDGAFVTFMVFRDYNKRIATSAVRCTEKAVRAAHAAELDRMMDLARDAVAHQIALGDTFTQWDLPA